MRVLVRLTPLVPLLVLSGCDGLGAAWSATEEATGEPFVLTADDVRFEAAAELTVLPAQAPTGQDLLADVMFEATFEWFPPAGDPAPERPGVRVTIAPMGATPSGAGVESTVLSERERTTLSVVASGLDGCSDADSCLENFRIEVERDGAPSAGEIAVEWTALAEVWGSEGSGAPSGLGVFLDVETF